ncbi:hypothetical protein SAY87_012152 [Trapa incisa]|uniref:PPM-type phosphatase domain-containing protein n=1 Tax=Trapa incisa TaxID=236973 RepID=A0AAN7JJI4_9MYRT|nr:hypothetical protein SAY87_012152 [Trapa incisa]
MADKEILHKMKEKVGFGSASSDSGKGKSKMSNHITHGFYLVKGKSFHAMEDYAVAQFKQLGNNELGLFAIFDGHLSHEIPDYLPSHLAYRITDTEILEKAADLGKGGSTAQMSRAVISKRGVAKQLSVDHEPNVERQSIEGRCRDVPRVDGQLAVSRAFGDKSLKEHLSSEPHVVMEEINDDTELIILASDGLWTVMSNQEAVDLIKNVKDARSAAKVSAEGTMGEQR